MTWFKVDDGFHSHPKTIKVGMSSRGLWVTAGSWSADQLTDGFVPKSAIKMWGGTKRQVKELVEAGLWVEVENGWRFHGWAERQPTRKQVEKKREETALRVAKYRRSNSVTSSVVTPPPTRPDPTRKSRESESPVATSDALEVFGCWLEHHWSGKGPKPKFDSKRRSRIQARLREHDAATLKAAIRGALADDWIMGRDPKSRRSYRGIETILRDASQVERLAELDGTPSKPTETIGVPADYDWSKAP